jgi:hypothetical protein
MSERTGPVSRVLFSLLTVALVAMCGRVMGSRNAADERTTPERNAQQMHTANERYDRKPPFQAQDFWTKVLALLNARDGSGAKERIESVFGVRFRDVSVQSDETVYRLHAREDWYFAANVVIYNAQFRALTPAENGAHIQWYIGWRPDSFGDPLQGQCLTAARIRPDLVGSGWTDPWRAWDTVGQRSPTPAHADPFTVPVFQENPGPPKLPPNFNFFRAADTGPGARDRLPRGELYMTGESADSCLIGIALTAAP